MGLVGDLPRAGEVMDGEFWTEQSLSLGIMMDSCCFSSLNSASFLITGSSFTSSSLSLHCHCSRRTLSSSDCFFLPSPDNDNYSENDNDNDNDSDDDHSSSDDDDPHLSLSLPLLSLPGEPLLLLGNPGLPLRPE